jgi:hypothetical protein
VGRAIAKGRQRRKEQLNTKKKLRRWRSMVENGLVQR